MMNSKPPVAHAWPGELIPVWTSPESDNSQSIAWGDWDGDGDLAVGNYDAMTDPDQSVQTMLEVRPNLYLMPANLDLAGAELAFINAIDRNTKLRKALAPSAHLISF